MKVLFLASEMNPFAKAGGLGDVVGALPKALNKNNIDVRVALPKYGIIDPKQYPMKLICKGIPVPFGNTEYNVDVYQAFIPKTKIPVYLIENKKFLGQGGIYFDPSAFARTQKEIDRFLFFSRACLEIIPDLKWYPEILHCHDWHTAFVPLWLKTIYCCSNPLYIRMKTVFTIHNLANQGLAPLEVLKKAELTKNSWNTLKKDAENKDIDFMVQGILTANKITTVSKQYAKEILTKEYGEKLEHILGVRQKDLVGITNGIDIEAFNPETDMSIPFQYSSRNTANKEKNKKALQEFYHLPLQKNTPILGLVSRLTDQKGIDLVGKIIDKFKSLDMQLIVLGTGDPKLENIIKRAAKKYPAKIKSSITFDAKLAQLIYAGSDMFLVPSRFEPCGLTQMIAMRYGTVPIVRSTGGLKDTVAPYGTKPKAKNEGIGFVFEEYKPEALLKAILDALKIYRNKEEWKKIMAFDMKRDFSWPTSAKEYIKVYRKLLQ